MRKIDVLFLVEHVDRELDAATCLVQKLQSRFGMAADVRNFYSDMHYCLRTYQPRVVALPFCYFLNHHPMKDYVATWSSATFLNLAWEQILYKMNRLVKVPKDDFAQRSVHHVCWSHEYRDFLAAAGVVPDKLIVSGNPILKFYDLPYSNYFVRRKQLARTHGLDPSKKWVLIPENYRWAFLSEGQKSTFIAQGANNSFLNDAQAYCRRSLNVMFQWLRDLKETGDPEIILRPRPATALADMKVFMERAVPGGCSNLRIIKSETVRDWILASDHVISSYSTTLIEASLAGKPIHVFSPEPFPEALEDEWYAQVPLLKDRDTFLDAVRAPSREQTWRPLSDWARAKLLPAGDPFEVLTTVIGELCQAARPAIDARATPDYLRPSAARIAVERLRKRIQRMPAYHRLLQRHDPRYTFTINKHEKDIFGADDVASSVQRWETVLSGSAAKETPDQTAGALS